MTRSKIRKRGAALISVIVMGTISIAFMLALSSIVVSSVRSSSANKWVEGLRNAAEIGIDYTVDQFNTSYPCALDPPSGTQTLVKQLPSIELQAAQSNGITPTTGGQNIVVTIRVKRLQASDWLQVASLSSIYSPQLDPTTSSSQVWTSPPTSTLTATSGGGLRIVESTASNGIASRTIRVLLKARFDTQPDGSKLSGGGGGSSSTSSYFQRPFFGNSSVSLNGPVTLSGYVTDANGSTQDRYLISPSNGTPYSAYYLNVSSNHIASITGGATVIGDVSVTSVNSSNNPLVSASNGTIEGRVLTNGAVDSSVIDYNNAGNVKANADLSPSQPTRLGDNATAPISTPSNPSQYQLAPVPTPASSTNLAPLSTYADSGVSPTAKGDSVFSTATLDTSQIAAGKSVPFDNPVRIFINQDGNLSSAVNIDTSKIGISSSQAPSSFQIWYDGNKPVNINMNNNTFNAMIYAPNAPVNITGTGNFKGALVGKDLNVKVTGTSTISIDNTFTGGSTGGGGGGQPNPFLYSTRPGEGAAVQGWQPVTWQEYGNIQ